MHNTGCALATRWGGLLCYSCRTPKNSWCCWRGHLVSPLTRSKDTAFHPRRLQSPPASHPNQLPHTHTLATWGHWLVRCAEGTTTCKHTSHSRPWRIYTQKRNTPTARALRCSNMKEQQLVISKCVAFSAQDLPYQTKSINPPGNTIREITGACSKPRWPYRYKSRELALCSPDPRLTLNPVQGWLVFVPQSRMLTSVKPRLQVQCRLFSARFQSRNNNAICSLCHSHWSLAFALCCLPDLINYVISFFLFFS